MPKHEYYRFEIVDFNSKALSKLVPGRHKEEQVYMYAGALAMGANSKVLTFPTEVMDAGCPNSKLIPDWTTTTTLPWLSNDQRTVHRVFCESEGTGTEKACPRTLCRQLLSELGTFPDGGIEILAASELEFVVVQKGDDGKLAPMFEGVDIFATLQNSKANDLFFAIQENMEEVGVDIRTMNTEYGAGQLEITMQPSRGIQCADNAMTYRTGVKELCQQRGLLATFMAHPFGLEGVGNGGHFNFSLWSGSDSITYDPESPYGLSSTASSFLAGILDHACALEALVAPTPACYTRHGHWAPLVANWGLENRMACVRVKVPEKGDPSGCYMEFRAPSASACPYLILAGVVASGLDGLRRKLQLPPPNQTEEEGALTIPKTLEDSLAALRADTYLREKLGETFVRWYTGLKEGELAQIHKETEGNNSRLSAAWQDMYIEFV